MTDYIRITAVQDGAGDYWIVRGDYIEPGLVRGIFVGHTKLREIAAMCIGAKGYPVEIERNESGDIVNVKASVL